MNKLSISLYIYTGEKDPFDISNELGIKPSRIGKKGELLYKKSKSTFSQNQLLYKLEAGKDLVLDKLMTKFLEKFKASGRLKKVLNKYDSELCVVTYFNDRSFVLHLSNKNLKAISDLGLDFGIDYYILPEEEN